MVFECKPKSECVVVDTSAFIRNANLQEIGEKIITCTEVVDEIKSKRQLRRLVVLPYDLQVKEVFPENVKLVSEFSKKTGDYPSLSATDLKVLALTYQLEKEHVGTEHLKTIPDISRSVDYCNYSAITSKDIVGFYQPKKDKSSKSNSNEQNIEDENGNEERLADKLDDCNINEEDNSEYLSACSDSSDLDEFSETLEETANEKDEDADKEKYNSPEKERKETSPNMNQLDRSINLLDSNIDISDVFKKVDNKEMCSSDDTDEDEIYSGESTEDEEDDNLGWITPSNIKQKKQEMDAESLEEKPVKVACLTMDFAMQNVLKQMGLNVLSLDGRVIKQIRTFILRCYACFKTTSVMTKVFCHHCGNKTLKKVAVSLDAQGNQKIHINLRRPLTARGKKYSLPKPTGGKHSNYPILSEDQPVPDQRPTRLARTKTNPLDPDYIAGFSPFVMRDVNSKSAMLGVPNKAKDMKYWMKRNPNESSGRKKK